ncbi:MAG: alpha/beta fold hydrolase [Burkholderiales bacterium]
MARIAHPSRRLFGRRSLRGTGIALVALVGLALAGCAVLATKERELTFRPERGTSGWFTGLPSDVQEFYLPVTGGPTPERVHAWFWPHPHPSAPTLLYLHGVRWNLTAHLRRIENLRSFGFTVMAIDYRGFGQSDGDLPSEESVYEDAHAAWRWVVEREPDAAKRFVYGHSLGTAVATHLASDEGGRDGLGGLILEGAFTNLPEMAAALAPSWLPIDRLVTQRFDTRSKIARVAAPVLLVHGTEDRMVPHRFSKALYDAAREPKKLVLVEGGGHYNTSWVGSAAYRQALAELFRLPIASAQTGAGGVARVSTTTAGRAPAIALPAYAAP